MIAAAVLRKQVNQNFNCDRLSKLEPEDNNFKELTCRTF
jgi:hypothetical protein